MNAVADAVAKEYPGVKVDTLAYQKTFMAPKTIRPRDNVVIHLCTDVHCWGGGQFLTVEETDKFQAAMKGWAALGAHIDIWDYLVNFSNYLLPMPNMEVTTANIRFYLAHNATGVMLQSAYQSPGGADAPLKSWVWAKLLWDPSRDTRALMRDFVYGYYGSAAEPMWRYQELLWQLGERWHRDHSQWYTYDARFTSTANALFDEAEKLARDDETRRRVELARLSLQYVDLNDAFAHLCQTGKPDPRVDAAIAKFISVAKREKVTHLSEGRTGIEYFTDSLTALANSDGSQSTRWTAKLPQGEAQVLRLPARWHFAADFKDQGLKEAWFAPTIDDSKWVGCRTDLNCGWEKQGFARSGRSHLLWLVPHSPERACRDDEAARLPLFRRRR